VWLRVADPDWPDPLDPSWAEWRGGRWNPARSFRALYLNADPSTAVLQITKMLRGSPVRPEDLDDDAYVLVAATLPRRQRCAEAVTDGGLRALGLPASYPLDDDGGPVGHAACQPVGRQIRDLSLRGVVCRSAATMDGGGRELAWFPATRRSRARAVWDRPLPLGEWREARAWTDVGLPAQPRVP
jgi:hypothetical protein